ncbi:hypothetical protein BKA80DRAFT_280323 [Phyllosticta citrichinensis]
MRPSLLLSAAGFIFAFYHRNIKVIIPSPSRKVETARSTSGCKQCAKRESDRTSHTILFGCRGHAVPPNVVAPFEKKQFKRLCM